MNTSNHCKEETLTSLEHLSIQPSRLEIKESAEVGSGGYGEVLLAKMDPLSSLVREVAVKQLRAVGTRGIRVRLAFVGAPVNQFSKVLTTF